MENLSVGRIVQYVLNEQDVKAIIERRENLSKSYAWGNPPTVGDVVPAIVVWPHHNEASTFNGQAFLDGNDVLWITSVPYSAEAKPRTWHWPARV